MLDFLLFILVSAGLLGFALIMSIIILYIAFRFGPSDTYYEKRKKEEWKPWLS